MPTTLGLSVKTTNEFIINSTEWTKISVTVTAKSRPKKNATVAFSVTSGSGEFTSSSATTDKYGVCNTRFRATATGYIEVTVTASLTGYTNGSFIVTIISLTQPTEWASRGTLYLNLLEVRKRNIIEELRDYLDNDTDFSRYPGGTDTITFLEEWNYQQENFPQIVVSSMGPTFQFTGLNHIIDNSTFGGWVDVTFNLNVMAETKTILDRLTEKCIFILGSLKFLDLYGKYGIFLKMPMTTGDVVTEPWGAKVVYANRISLNTRIEMAYNIEPSTTIGSIYLTGTTY